MPPVARIVLAGSSIKVDVYICLRPLWVGPVDAVLGVEAGPRLYNGQEVVPCVASIQMLQKGGLSALPGRGSIPQCWVDVRPPSQPFVSCFFAERSVVSLPCTTRMLLLYHRYDSHIFKQVRTT